MRIIQRVKNVFFSVVIGLGFIGVSCGAIADGLSEEASNLNHGLERVVNANNIRQKAVEMKAFARDVKWSGVSDSKLFDRLESDMLKVMQSGIREEKYGAEYLSWAAHALAYSGLEKYEAVLNKLDTRNFHKKIRRHAQNALGELSSFAIWNPKINQGLTGVAAEDLRRHRTINLLSSGEGELIRVGASFATKRYYADEEVLSLAEKVLLSTYAQVGDNDADMAEAIAWLCKVLGASGNSKYRPTLEKVLESSNNRMIVRWAQKSLQRL